MPEAQTDERPKKLARKAAGSESPAGAPEGLFRRAPMTPAGTSGRQVIPSALQAHILTDTGSFSAERLEDTAMISAVLVFNNNGQPRLTKFYTQLVEKPSSTGTVGNLANDLHRTPRLSRRC